MLTTLKDVAPVFLILFYSLGTFLLALRCMFYALEDAQNKDLTGYLFSLMMAGLWCLVSIALAVIATT